MNSTENLEHTAQINNQLLFPSIFKHAWGIFKQKWGTLYALSLIPIIFIVAAYAIFISTIYIVMKLAGDSDLLISAASVFHFAPGYVSALAAICGIITLVGIIYFSLRSTISSIKVLESDSKMSIRHAWHGISFKSITALFSVVVLFGIIVVGGYILLFIPALFLVLFIVM